MDAAARAGHNRHGYDRGDRLALLEPRIRVALDTLHPPARGAAARRSAGEG